MWRGAILLAFVALALMGCSAEPTSMPQAAADTPTSVPPIANVTPTSAPPTATPLPPTSTPVPPTETPLPPTPTSTLTPTPSLPTDPAAGDSWTRPADGMVMVFVPAGEFEMGSTGDDPCAHLDEMPLHTVHLDGYWIDQTPVTNAQYQACVEAGVCAPVTTCGWGESGYGDPAKEDHPVTCVDFYSAQTYCQWIDGELPTEAQWEKAARGTDVRRYPWGDEFDLGLCNSGESGLQDTTPVRFYSLAGDSPFGVSDMSGNVWEWVTDWYDLEYYGRSPKRNPTGPFSGERRGLRGGSWYGDACNARTSYRYYDLSSGRGPGVGFRCVRPAGE